MHSSTINAVIRISVLGFMAVLIDRVAVQAVELNRRVMILEGMLPVCVGCRRIRDERESWQALDQYVASHPMDKISKELCPDCVARYDETFGRR